MAAWVFHSYAEPGVDLQRALKMALLHDLVEIDAGDTFDSALDRFLPVFSNFLNDGHSWKKHGIPIERVVAKNEPPIRAGLPGLWGEAEAMIRAALGA
jgi:hypothetical protein